jgi:hypothetical protein
MKDFETELDLGLLKTGTIAGGITDVLLEEDQGGGNYKHSHIIRTDRSWRVNINWELRGTLLDSKFLEIPGKWLLTVYLEGWGKQADEIDVAGDSGGVEVKPAPKVVKAGSLSLAPLDPPETVWQYTEQFSFAPGAIKTGNYKLAVAITYVDDDGIPGPMAGFIDLGGMVQVYNPGP